MSSSNKSVSAHHVGQITFTEFLFAFIGWTDIDELVEEEAELVRVRCLMSLFVTFRSVIAIAKRIPSSS